MSREAKKWFRDFPARSFPTFKMHFKKGRMIIRVHHKCCLNIRISKKGFWIFILVFIKSHGCWNGRWFWSIHRVRTIVTTCYVATIFWKLSIASWRSQGSRWDWEFVIPLEQDAKGFCSEFPLEEKDRKIDDNEHPD